MFLEEKKNSGHIGGKTGAEVKLERSLWARQLKDVLSEWRITAFVSILSKGKLFLLIYT